MRQSFTPFLLTGFAKKEEGFCTFFVSLVRSAGGVRMLRAARVVGNAPLPPSLPPRTVAAVVVEGEAMGLTKAGIRAACSASRASKGGCCGERDAGGERDWGRIKGRASLGTDSFLGVVKEEEGRECMTVSLGFCVVGEVGSTAPGR